MAVLEGSSDLVTHGHDYGDTLQVGSRGVADICCESKGGVKINSRVLG